MCSIVLIHPSQFHLSICITAIIFNISKIVLWGRDVTRSNSFCHSSLLAGCPQTTESRGVQTSSKRLRVGQEMSSLSRETLACSQKKKKKRNFQTPLHLRKFKKKELCSVQLNTYVAQMLAGGLPTPQELCKISSNLYQRIPRSTKVKVPP